MNNNRSLSHSVYECKYHVVWIPKYRKNVIYENLRRHLGKVFRELARQKEREIEEGHLMADHVHTLIYFTLMQDRACCKYFLRYFQLLDIKAIYIIFLVGRC
jgi:REP element-mobilizing transposase RayT